jgi:transcriptional regulator with XRE-family HTH domain
MDLLVSSGRATDVEISAYLAHRLVREMERGELLTDIARRAGVTPAQLSTLKNTKRGAGWKTLTGLARAFSMSIGDVEDAARRQARGETPTDSRVERDERYPNRAKALAAARALGLSEEAIAEVASMDLKSDVDPEPLDWLEDIKSADRRAKYAAKVAIDPKAQEREAAAKVAEQARLDELAEAMRPKLPKKPKK